MSARCIVLFSWYLTRKGSRRTRNARGGCKVWRLRFPLSWLLYGKIFCWRRKCGCWCDGLVSAAQVHSAPGHCDTDPGGFLHWPGQQLPFKWRGEQLGLNLLQLNSQLPQPQFKSLVPDIRLYIPPCLLVGLLGLEYSYPPRVSPLSKRFPLPPPPLSSPLLSPHNLPPANLLSAIF